MLISKATGESGNGEWGMGHGAWGMGNNFCFFPMSDISATLSTSVRCPMPHARCPMPNAPCPMPNSRCPIPDAPFPNR
ncbi:MAG: hypothetical protein WBL95_23975 [Microcoleus sp.]